jgi:hypothetical protein
LSLSGLEAQILGCDCKAITLVLHRRLKLGRAARVGNLTRYRKLFCEVWPHHFRPDVGGYPLA